MKFQFVNFSICIFFGVSSLAMRPAGFVLIKFVVYFCWCLSEQHYPSRWDSPQPDQFNESEVGNQSFTVYCCSLELKTNNITLLSGNALRKVFQWNISSLMRLLTTSGKIDSTCRLKLIRLHAFDILSSPVGWVLRQNSISRLYLASKALLE